MVDQYEGGYAGRADDIESGSVRSVEELIGDVRGTADACERAWTGLEPGAWSALSRDVSGRERPLFELPARRWQEVEVHLVDIDAGFTHEDWPEDFIAEWLPRAREQMRDSLPPELQRLRFGSEADELAWLYGRLRRADVPQPPPWG